MLRRLRSLLPIVALVSILSMVCQAQSPTLMTRHTREDVTTGRAVQIGRLPASQSMRIVLVLQHQNQPGLDNFLKDLYDPSSSSYRQFLTVDQFTEKYGPSRADYETVKDFARANGLQINRTSRNRMILAVTGPVANIEKALHVNFGIYQHPTENRTFFAPDREPTPELSVRLWSIGGLDTYSVPRPALVRRDPNTPRVIGEATTGSCPQASFCGSDMRAAYYTGGTLNGSGQSLGLFEFIGTDLVDLTTYFTNVGQTNNVPITLLSVDTQSTSCVDKQGCDDTEQTLDMTQAIGMAPGLSSLVMYIGTGGLSGQTLDDAGILNGMATASPLNAQLSASWLWKPADTTVDEPFFQQFAAQGQNFFNAAGDDGKWAKGGFSWPSDDGFITSVGGTSLKTTGAGGAWASETGWSDSGGGISQNNISIPSWQVTTAAGCAKCSQTLRNGPDISANSDFTFYVCADQTSCTANNYGGTSFATPMWAGFLALVNQQAVANGQPTLGFINPAIYNIGLGSTYDADFHDITSGSNGFSATTGYDQNTGWGSPTGQALIDALAPPSVGSFTLTSRPTTLTIAPGQTGKAKITSAISGTFNSSIALTATGQGPGVTVGFNPSTIAAPGSGVAEMQIKVSPNAAAGNHKITVTGTGGGVTQATTVTIVIN